jgi:hypothetical protein
MKLSKCCDAEIKFGMVDDLVGHGIHEETECSNCGESDPESYDDEEEEEEEECKHERKFVSVRHESGPSLTKCWDCGKKFFN